MTKYPMTKVIPTMTTDHQTRPSQKLFQSGMMKSGDKM
jgi:hypothetical protein